MLIPHVSNASTAWKTPEGPRLSFSNATLHAVWDSNKTSFYLEQDETMTHVLRTQEDRLIVKYSIEHTKVTIHQFVLKRFESMHLFSLAQVWVNRQPAESIKGFQARIIQVNVPIESAMQKDNLYLSINFFTSFTITIESKDERYALTVSPNLKIKGLYKIIEEELKLADFALYCQGEEKPLARKRTLESYAIIAGGSLMLLMHADPYAWDADNQGKLPTELAPLSFSYMECEERLPFVQGPPWREVVPGLNLRGKCATEGCLAENQIVWIQKGVGTFEMIETANTARCPQCEQVAIDVNNVGFYACLYSIKGIKKNGEGIDRDPIPAPEDELLTFKDSPGFSSEQWLTLDITTKSIADLSNPLCILC